MAVNPINYSYSGIPIYRDSDFDLSFSADRHGIIHTYCPIGDHKHHDRRLCISKESGFLWCFDPACCQKGILESKYLEWMKTREQNYSAAYNSKKVLDSAIDLCSPEVIKYLREQRGFSSLEAFKKLGVKEIDHYYGKDDTARSLCFLFYLGDKVVNAQYKRVDGKKDFRQDGGVRIPYNINAVIGRETVIITEGQMDTAALVSCGFDNTISVPNGSNSRMECFDEVSEYLSTAKQFIFAVDNDEAGILLRNKLYGRFGTDHECYYIDFNYHNPDDDKSKWFDAKDANECLIKGGEEAVRWCMSHPKECLDPYEVTADSVAEGIDDVFYNGLPVGEKLGLEHFDKYVSFLPGRLYVVTGTPSSGKSNVIDFWITRLAFLHGWKSTVFSPEKEPSHEHFTEFIHRIIGKPVTPAYITKKKLHDTRHKLSSMITHLEMGGDNSIDSIKDAISRQIKKRGIKVAVIDPFNFVKIEGAAWSESGAINDMLVKLKDFAKKKNILIILMAHPKKATMLQNGEYQKIRMYDISGSAAFYNVCDVGIVITRDRKHNYTEVFIEKARDEDRIGNVGTAYLWFSKETGRYADVVVNNDLLHGAQAAVEYLDMDKSDWSVAEPEQQEFNFYPDETKEDDCPF